MPCIVCLVSAYPSYNNARVCLTKSVCTLGLFNRHVERQRARQISTAAASRLLVYCLLLWRRLLRFLLLLLLVLLLLLGLVTARALLLLPTFAILVLPLAAGDHRLKRRLPIPAGRAWVGGLGASRCQASRHAWGPNSGASSATSALAKLSGCHHEESNEQPCQTHRSSSHLSMISNTWLVVITVELASRM